MMADNRKQRLSVARSQLEAGLKPATVALRLQVKFAISRSTAYADVNAASNEIQQSDDGPAGWEQPDNSADLVHRLLYDADLCLAAGQYGDACKLIGAADRVKRWNGSTIAVPAEQAGTAGGDYA
jgi:hypothetical protein